MFKRKTEEVKDFEGTSNTYLTKSGMYEDVIIKALIYDEADNGGAVVNLFVENDGKAQMVYGDIRVYNKGGKDNAIGQSMLNELLVILDIEDLGEPVEAELPIGKAGGMKDCLVFESVEDLPISIKILNKYDTWKGNITEKSTVNKFYRQDDKATAAEIISMDAGGEDAVEAGTKFNKDLEYAENVKYDGGTSPQSIDAWIKAKRPKGTAGNATSSTTTAKPSFKKPKSKFGNK